MADKNTNSSPVTSISFTPKSPTKTSGLPVANVNPMSGTIMPALNPKIVTDAKPSKPFKAPTGVHWRELLNAPLKFVEKIGKEVIDEVSPWITPPTPLERNGITVLDGEENPYKSPTDTRSTTPYTPYVNNTGYVPNPESPYGKYLKEPLYLPQPLDRGGINVVKSVVYHPEDVTHPAYQFGDPVPEGHTRLYRGEDTDVEYNPKDTHPQGRWWSLDPAAADEFARGNISAPESPMYDDGRPRDKKQVIYYVDVPNKDLAKWQVPTRTSSYVDKNAKGTSKYVSEHDFAENIHTEDYKNLLTGQPRKNITKEDLLQLQVEKQRLQERSAKAERRKQISEYPQFLLPESISQNKKKAKNVTEDDVAQWESFLINEIRNGNTKIEDLNDVYSPGYTKAIAKWYDTMSGGTKTKSIYSPETAAALDYYDKVNEEPIEYTGMSPYEKETFDWKKAYNLEHLPQNIKTYDQYLNSLKRKNGLVVTDKETGNYTEFSMPEKQKEFPRNSTFMNSTYDNERKARVIMRDRDDALVGYLDWDIISGEIMFVHTSKRGEKYSHELIRKAREFAKENNIPAPEHSASRTKLGDKFAAQDAKNTQKPYPNKYAGWGLEGQDDEWIQPEPRSPRPLIPPKDSKWYKEYSKLINSSDTTKQQYLDFYSKYRTAQLSGEK